MGKSMPDASIRTAASLPSSTSGPEEKPAGPRFQTRAFIWSWVYCGPVLRHAAEPTQTANFRSAVVF